MAQRKAQKSDQATVRQEDQSPEILTGWQGDDGYKVGPGCPPKEYQFKPGQSGNPKAPRGCS